jgi:hypothetical protein
LLAITSFVDGIDKEAACRNEGIVKNLEVVVVPIED